MKAVLIYEGNPAGLALARTLFPTHHARWQEFRERGVLLMIGTFKDPAEGAMAVFTCREAAEEFANGDPFVLNGAVEKWIVREWNEALM